MSRSEKRRETAAKIRHLLDTEGEAIHENTARLNRDRYAAAEAPGYEALREHARELKEEAIENLPELIEELRASVEANGGTLYLADDAADANEYIESVMEEENADSMVKSKSMTTEELDLNDHLEASGHEVYETDLGEFVIQVADEAPSHLIGPSLHKSTAEIADLFNGAFDPETELETADDLTRFARDYLGERIREADVGLTGANFILAESGSIAIVTNEGNARKCAVTPDTHVAVSGVEKILPSLSELQPFTELIARAGTGQDISQYVSLLTPPVESPSLDFEDPEVPITEQDGEDRDFHLVLIDNGRMAMREDPDLKETLYCIRCGACANSCSNFQHVGGHAFGGETYTGGIATGWEAGIEGQDTAAEFNDLCTGCSRCADACPVKIDIPWINTAVRDRINRSGEPEAYDFLVEGLTPDAEPGGLDVQKRVFGNFETLAKLGSKTAPVSNWLADSRPARAAMERFLGIDTRRELPSFERETLREWFEGRDSRTVEDPRREVALYPDTYTNYVHVERGKAAVRVLEALGCDVTIPAIPDSGRAPFSQGMVETARERANAVAAAFETVGERDVVVIEPSDLAMFRREYERLLSEDAHERVAERSYEVLEYVYGLLEHGADPAALTGGDEPVAYHSHCQQRTLDLEAHTVAVLERLGYGVETSEQECCGMAGSFGYKSEYYELSADIGAELADQFEGAETVVASGTSCTEQLDAMLKPGTKHPVELLDPAR